MDTLPATGYIPGVIVITAMLIDVTQACAVVIGL